MSQLTDSSAKKTTRKAAPAKAGAAKTTGKTPGKPQSKASAKAAGKAKPTPRKTPPKTPAKPVTKRQTPLVPIVAVLALGLDQLSKWVVIQRMNLPLYQEIDLIDPWLNLRMAWNQGMNFGLMASSQDLTRWLLIGVALVICVWVSVWVWRAKPGRLARIAAGLLIGGALGNVIDRVSYGAVADFLNMSLPGWRNPYSFNVADIAIFAGALGLIFQPQKRDEADKTAPPRTKGGKPRQRTSGKKSGRNL